MKTEQSKTTFAVIISVVAIITIIGFLQVFGFGNYATGYATSALGTATVNITGLLSIKLIDMNITFGVGTFNAQVTSATLESNGTAVVNGTWAAVNDPFILENDGNVLANITIKASQSAADWFGGTASLAAMYYRFQSNETGSCVLEPGILRNDSWWSLPVSPSVSEACQKLNYTDTNDTLRVDMKIQIPADAPVGLKANAVTFIASQSA